MPAPSTPHDEFFKEIFGEPDHARDLLQGILPPEVRALLDLDRLQREEGSFLTPQLAEDFADLLFTCPIQGGSAIVALLLEHKSWAPRHPHLQLLVYMLGIWERAEKEAQPLPLVIPIVLYNGLGEWKVLDLSESFPGLPPALLPFLPSFRFLLMDLVREPLEPLRERFGNRSVRLALELMRAIFSPEEVRALMERLTPEDGPLDRDLALRFLRVVLRYIFKRSDTTVREALALNLHPELREQTMTMEEEVLLRGEQRGLAKGVAKGIEQGLRQNALENARKMLDRGCAWPFITDVTGIRPEDLAG
jgi:predicted transposase/invertase (TIGR01784 family)